MAGGELADDVFGLPVGHGGSSFDRKEMKYDSSRRRPASWLCSDADAILAPSRRPKAHRARDARDSRGCHAAQCDHKGPHACANDADETNYSGADHRRTSAVRTARPDMARRVGAARHSRRLLPAGRAFRLDRPDLHPHLGARSGRARAFPAQPLRAAVRRGDGLEPDQGRSRRQPGRGARRAHAQGRLRHSQRHPRRPRGRRLRHPHPFQGRRRGRRHEGRDFSRSASTRSCSTGA